MASQSNSPSESLVFLVILGGMIVFATLISASEESEKRADYRLRECVVNLEQVAVRQEEVLALSGRYLECPPFPDEVPGDDPVLWKLPCDPAKSAGEEGEERFADCVADEICSADMGCLARDDDGEEVRALVPECWRVLMGLGRDTVMRGQYRSEAPYSIGGPAGARFDLTCRTDLTGEGVITQYRATESKTTWQDREITR